jgi:hypothetical protein
MLGYAPLASTPIADSGSKGSVTTLLALQSLTAEVNALAITVATEASLVGTSIVLTQGTMFIKASAQTFLSGITSGNLLGSLKLPSSIYYEMTSTSMSSDMGILNVKVTKSAYDTATYSKSHTIYLNAIWGDNTVYITTGQGVNTIRLSNLDTGSNTVYIHR